MFTTTLMAAAIAAVYGVLIARQLTAASSCDAICDAACNTSCDPACDATCDAATTCTACGAGPPSRDTTGGQAGCPRRTPAGSSPQFIFLDTTAAPARDATGDAADHPAGDGASPLPRDATRDSGGRAARNADRAGAEIAAVRALLSGRLNRAGYRAAMADLAAADQGTP